MHTAFSDDINGIGMMISSPYSDTESILNLDLSQQGIEFAEAFSKSGDIDNTDNLQGNPVWIFSGNQDTGNKLIN